MANCGRAPAVTEVPTVMGAPAPPEDSIRGRANGAAMAACAEEGCDREAAVRLHVPWAEDREVCAAHARALAQRDGVVAEPLDGSDAWR